MKIDAIFLILLVSDGDKETTAADFIFPKMTRLFSNKTTHSCRAKFSIFEFRPAKKILKINDVFSIDYQELLPASDFQNNSPELETPVCSQVLLILVV